MLSHVMPDFPIPVLVTVLKARYTGTAGFQDLEIVVTNHCGNPDPETIWYTRDVNEEWLSDGRLYTLGLEIDAWFGAHPEFSIEPYVATAPAPELTPAEKFAAATGLSIEDLRALVKE